MYSIDGNGSWQHTTVRKNGNKIEYTECIFCVTPSRTFAMIDGEEGDVEWAVISGVYTIISGGKFNNTKILIGEEELRGVQSLGIEIIKDKHPVITINAILLPNIIENVK